jgi:hypothetical protein
MIYLPGSGIVAAYTDPSTGKLNVEFDQALGLYYTAWFIVTFFLMGAVRASWVVVGILSLFDLECLLLANGLMSGNTHVLKAANSIGFIVSFLCCKYILWKDAHLVDLRVNELIGVGPPDCMLHQLHRGISPRFLCTRRSEECNRLSYRLRDLLKDSVRGSLIQEEDVVGFIILSRECVFMIDCGCKPLAKSSTNLLLGRANSAASSMY